MESAPHPCYTKAMPYEIRKAVKLKCAYFTVHWSPIVKADKYQVTRSVPSMGGIAELYYQDDHGKLNLYMLARSYYGGLRATLRSAVDPETERDAGRLAVLTKYEDKIFYRYTCMESQDDMSDIMFFFLSTYMKGGTTQKSSGRYERIFLKEVDTGDLVTI